MQRRRASRKEEDSLSQWGIADSIDLYGVERWSDGIFSVNKDGHVCLVGQKGIGDIDLKALMDEIRLRGLEPPVLIRFTDILRRRLDLIAEAFHKAIREHKYQGEFRGVYPIKVNQHRHILDDLVALGRKHHYGLECGSKPELLLSIAMHDDPEAVIICNGFKDRDYVETALFARRLGTQIFLVVEKPSELPLILDVAKEMNVDPLIGIRMKLSSRGKGMWETSGGDRSKFGLRADEIVEAVELLKRRKKLATLQLLHWHIGSQISDIQRIKTALKEATSFFIELSRMGAPIRYIDAGGGLAVDYDGSHTNFASSANYSPREYAADVVDALCTACEEASLPHPTIVTEAGRALVAHHSVLVVEAFSASGAGGEGPVPSLPKSAPEILHRLADIQRGLVGKNFQETFHDALEARRDALMLFNLRHLSLRERATAEQYFWAICHQILDYVNQLDYVPDEMVGLEKLLSTTYYCNFSVFQSVPDHWAIKQLFPVVPLHRLDEKPTVEGSLADITCDSDGVMNQFVDLRDVSETLSLHPLREGEPYYLGVFLVGAYQEILGDLHNLFGDTNVVHVSAGKDRYVIDKTVEGESIAEVLDYVQFHRRDLLARMRERVEAHLRRGTMKLEEAAPFMQEFDESLDDYTYYRVKCEKR